MAEALLSVENLGISFNSDRGVVRAVRGVSFQIERGETVGIVGESGCGKTVTALSIMGLVPMPPGFVEHGRIVFDGQDLLKLSNSEMRTLRGRDISMIFQEPMTALNPVFTVGTQMVDVLKRHQHLNGKQARERAIELLKTVRIPAPNRRIDCYPHELSGGMRQRVMIAMALSCGPKLMLADEPTTALDVTTQAQVMREMSDLQKQFGMAMILVTHDLGIIAETCTRVIVMYCGRIVEIGEADDLYESPKHPYTAGLLESIPRIRNKKIAKLPTIDGMVPDLLKLPAGCAFAQRCPKAQARCRQEDPPLEQGVACFFPMEKGESFSGGACK